MDHTTAIYVCAMFLSEASVFFSYCSNEFLFLKKTKKKRITVYIKYIKSNFD